jgi:tetratricopeptide (TPR) repeat protein
MAWESQQEREEMSAFWTEAMAAPALRERFLAVHQAVMKGDLTLAEVGGFTADELDSAFAGVVKLLNIGKVREALQISGYLILLSPWEARFYGLTAHCLHRHGKPQQAVHYYNIALALGEDGVMLASRGELHLQLGNRAQAQHDLGRALELLSPHHLATKPHLARAQKLYSMYFAGAQL